MRVSALAAVTVAGLLAGGASLPGHYQSMGAGALSCGSWSANRLNPSSVSAVADEEWALGFLSGIGYVGRDGADPLRDIDAEGVWGWLDNYCKANPIEHIGDAVTKFYYAHPN